MFQITHTFTDDTVMSNDRLVTVTEGLLNLIRSRVVAYISNPTIPPGERLYRKKEVVEYEETKTGGHARQWRPVFFIKTDWVQGADFIFSQVREHAQFRAFADEMGKGFPQLTEIEESAAKIIRLIVGGMFYEVPYDAVRVCSLLRDELGGKPLIFKIETELHGIALHVKEINLSFANLSVTLRQTNQVDFEKEVLDPEPEWLPHSPFPPAAMLSLKMPTVRGSTDMLSQLNRALIVLRLFRISTVDCGKQTITAESLIHYTHSTGYFGQARVGEYPLELKAEEVAHFVKFWELVSKRLPSHFCDVDKPDETFLTVAHERYCDSLFHKGAIEGKIAFAVMALEALFLTVEGELKYRLSVRIAKVLSRLGFDGEMVQREVSQAYDIRSIYVHGSKLSVKSRAKFERNAQVTLDQLRQKILGYVRNAILIYILCSSPKEQFLELLDASLLNTKSEATLDSTVKNCQEFMP